MGTAWADHPSWELVVEASEVVERDVAALLLDAAADELTETRNAQLATFVLSMVILDAVERTGLEPGRLAGHSLGEYSALCASGALAFDDAAQLVAERGEAMQIAAEERHGTMAAVLGLDDDQVDVVCHRVDGDVWVANFNAPGQVVIAGDPDAIEAARAVARELGAKRVMPLQVSGAFHTPFMTPALDRLKKALGEVEMRTPEAPVVANVDAHAHESAEEWTALLTSQLCSPVRWRQTLHRLADDGVSTFVELGPGTVLTGTVKRTLKAARRLSVATPADLDVLLESMHDEPQRGGIALEGEHLFASERIVVSPAAGVFASGAIAPGDDVEPGSVVGTVGEHDVRSPFAGSIMGLLAVDGERVTASQPIAWLRTA